MAEEEREVRTFIVEQRCENCSNGYMQFTVKNIKHSKTVYIHNCDYCNSTKNFKEKYPLTRYKV